MNIIENIIELLAEEKRLFILYEQQTDLLQAAQEDTADNYITKRGSLAIEIDNIHIKIDELLQQSDDALLYKAYKCEGNYSEYTHNYIAVYDLARDIYASVSRITDKNEEITAEMMNEREALRAKLASTKNTPTIKKYLGALGNTGSVGVFMGSDKKA